MSKNLIEGKTGLWEVVIGLEVHAQIISRSKLFCGCSTDFGAEPNTQVGFFGASMPGMLPVLNHVCVDQAIKTGLGLNGTVNLISAFDRKKLLLCRFTVWIPDLPIYPSDCDRGIFGY